MSKLDLLEKIHRLERDMHGTAWMRNGTYWANNLRQEKERIKLRECSKN